MSDKSRFFTKVDEARALLKRAGEAVMKANKIEAFDQDCNALALLTALQHEGVKLPEDWSGMLGSIAYVAGNTSAMRQTIEGKSAKKGEPSKVAIATAKLS